MTADNIIEGNKLIVVFMNGEIDMGITHITDSYTDENGQKIFKHIEGRAYLNFIGDDDTGNYEKTCMVANLQYHKSWSWLMPVVHQIKKWEHLPQYMFMGTTLERHMVFLSVTLLPICTPIEAVYKAVVEFIKWYNIQLETAPKSPKNKS